MDIGKAAHDKQGQVHSHVEPWVYRVWCVFECMCVCAAMFMYMLPVVLYTLRVYMGMYQLVCLDAN